MAQFLRSDIDGVAQVVGAAIDDAHDTGAGVRARAVADVGALATRLRHDSLPDAASAYVRLMRQNEHDARTSMTHLRDMLARAREGAGDFDTTIAKATAYVDDVLRLVDLFGTNYEVTQTGLGRGEDRTPG